MEFLKQYFVKKQIQTNLNRLKVYRPSVRSGVLQKVGCIIDMDIISNVEPLVQLVESFGLRPESIVFLGYRKQSNDTHIDGIPFLVDKDISWKGKIRNYHADRLAEQEYDMLINYFDQPKLPLLLLSSSVRAKLRVGVEGIDNQYNDIIVQCPLKDEITFANELKKILQTLK
ncbi:MAG: hypothetical protein Q4G08_06330 [Capnocytophaga sp.]|nr:hypothetical protein [Capnocytophaga sp.]